MAKSSTGLGGDFLAHKSDVVKLRRALPELSNVLIVDDETFDADRLTATLRVIFGYAIEVRLAKTLATAVDEVMKVKPQLIFLDDILKPSDTALETMPYLRRAGYEGPIVIVSGMATRRRANELEAAGAADIIHKDDVDSVRLGEALIRVLGQGSQSNEA